jgi:hypothetical protein
MKLLAAWLMFFWPLWDCLVAPHVSLILQSKHLILNPSKTCLHCVRVGASQTPVHLRIFQQFPAVYPGSADMKLKWIWPCSTCKWHVWIIHEITWYHMYYICTINNMSHHHQTNDILEHWKIVMFPSSGAINCQKWPRRGRNSSLDTTVWVSWRPPVVWTTGPGTPRQWHIAEIPPKKWAVETGESSIDPSVIPTEWAEHVFLLSANLGVNCIIGWFFTKQCGEHLQLHGIATGHISSRQSHCANEAGCWKICGDRRVIIFEGSFVYFCQTKKTTIGCFIED